VGSEGKGSRGGCQVGEGSRRERTAAFTGVEGGQVIPEKRASPFQLYSKGKRERGSQVRRGGRSASEVRECHPMFVRSCFGSLKQGPTSPGRRAGQERFECLPGKRITKHQVTKGKSLWKSGPA